MLYQIIKNGLFCGYWVPSIFGGTYIVLGLWVFSKNDIATTLREVCKIKLDRRIIKNS
jgi:hypothetical protein